MKPVVLRDGGRFVVRPMAAGDADAVRDGFASLSARSLRQRFFTPVPRLTAGMVADLVAVDPSRVVLLAFEEASGRLAGGARAIRSPRDPAVADVAVTVGDCFQRRGLGGALLRRLGGTARSDGIVRFGGHVLVDNLGARAMLAAAGARMFFEEPGVLRFEIPLADGEGRLPVARPARSNRRRRAA